MTEWMSKAECLGYPHLDDFFAGVGTAGEERAKETCAECIVRGRCLDYALKDADLEGVWGGLNDRERAQRRRRTYYVSASASTASVPVMPRLLVGAE